MYVGVKSFWERGFVAALFIFLCLSITSGQVSGEFADKNPVRPYTPLKVTTVAGDTHNFDTELALTNNHRSLGMMYRTELAPNAGMLFIFRDEQARNFWMRNTYIPLDIIFLDTEGRIINIQANVEPRSDTLRPSERPAKAVFEIAGGRAAELGIAPGDTVHHALLGNWQVSEQQAN